MSDVEYLNLRSVADLSRIRRELYKMGQTQPLDQVLWTYSTFRPEIAAFIARRCSPRRRLVLVHIDMDMAGLLMQNLTPENAEKARKILVGTVQYIHELLQTNDEAAIWKIQGSCCHMLVQCARALDAQAQAESYCILFHEVCRQITRHGRNRLPQEEDLPILYQMYEDTQRVFHAAAEPEGRLRAFQAGENYQRCLLWQSRMAERAERLKLAGSLIELADAYCADGNSPQLLQALRCYEKAMAIYWEYRDFLSVRHQIAELCCKLGDVWMRFDNTRSLLQAKEWYVKGLDAATVLHRSCQRQNVETDAPAKLLRECYRKLSNVCSKLPGEKNAGKAEKYLRLAEGIK